MDIIKERKMMKKKETMHTKRRNEILFLICLFTFPIIHKLVFYFGSNLTSFGLAFQKYDSATNTYIFDGFNQIKMVLSDLSTSLILRQSLKNTMKLYFVNLFISIPISLFCSYFVVKKVPGSGALKVIFFLPSIVSGVVMVLVFKYFCEYAIPNLATNIFGVKRFPLILQEKDTAFFMMIVYSLWTGFAGGIVLYVGTMSKTPEGCVEAAQLDGVSVLGEFWHITLPTVWPMLSVFLITGVTGMFTGGGPEYTFYGDTAPTYCYTMGYFLFTRVIGENASPTMYPYAAAVGFLVTIVAMPLTFGVKWLTEHCGPSEE